MKLKWTKNRLVNSARLFAIALLMVLLSACSTVTLTVTGTPAAIQSAPKIAIVETVLGAPELPVFPLIDAGIYKGQVREIGSSIIAEHQKNVAGFERELAHALERETGRQVLYGTGLYGTPEYQQLIASGIPLYPLGFDNDVVTQAVITQGAYNFFDFRGITNLRGYFSQSNPGVQQTMAQIASTINVDAVCIAVGTVITNGVSSFGISGNSYLEVEVYVYNRQGQLVQMGHATTEADSSSGDDIAGYASQLSQFPKEINRLVPVMAGKAKIQ